MKLIYVGKQETFGLPLDGRMWNVIDPSSPYHMSTRSLDGLKEIGLIGGSYGIVY